MILSPGGFRSADIRTRRDIRAAAGLDGLADGDRRLIASANRVTGGKPRDTLDIARGDHVRSQLLAVEGESWRCMQYGRGGTHGRLLLHQPHRAD